jgi:hypothetical protein
MLEFVFAFYTCRLEGRSVHTPQLHINLLLPRRGEARINVPTRARTCYARVHGVAHVYAVNAAAQHSMMPNALQACACPVCVGGSVGICVHVCM